MAPSTITLVYISSDEEWDGKLFLEKKPSTNQCFILHFLVLDNYLIASSASSHEGLHARGKESSAAKSSTQHLDFLINIVTEYLNNYFIQKKTALGTLICVNVITF